VTKHSGTVAASSQGNISGHLACLKGCGLVWDRPVGRQVKALRLPAFLAKPGFYGIAAIEVFDVLRAAEWLLARNGLPIEICPNYRGEGQ
jgi:ArsR family transcriptional regulator, cadmium/lead-responsive transcriptional repressor